MDRWIALRRFQISSPDSEPNSPTPAAVSSPPPSLLELDGDRGGLLHPQKSAPADLFPTKKADDNLRQLPSLDPGSRGDHINVSSKLHVMKILAKNGELKVLFADNILKVAASGKMKRQVLLITEFSIYFLDTDANTLKRRIAITSVKKLCLSNFPDHFLAIVIQREYDCLIASTRKMDIVSALSEATEILSKEKVDVSLSNSFTYRASSQVLKEIVFEKVEEGTKARIVSL